jgi:hypothetical protein
VGPFLQRKVIQGTCVLKPVLIVSCQSAVRLLKAGTHKDVTPLHTILPKAKQSEVKCTHGHESSFTIGY